MAIDGMADRVANKLTLAACLAVDTTHSRQRTDVAIRVDMEGCP
jgi:hypothetical protein